MPVQFDSSQESRLAADPRYSRKHNSTRTEKLTRPKDEHKLELLRVYGLKWSHVDAGQACTLCGHLSNLITLEGHCMVCRIKSGRIYEQGVEELTDPSDPGASMTEEQQREDAKIIQKVATQFKSINPLCCVHSEDDPAEEREVRERMLRLGILVEEPDDFYFNDDEVDYL